MLERNEQMFTNIRGELANLTQAVAQRTPLAVNPPAAAPPQETPAPTLVLLDRFLPTPRAFSGELGKCAGFLTQCSLQFRQQPQVFSNDGAKIAHIVQLLQDRALTWAQAGLHATPEMSFSNFLDKFKSVFDKESTAANAGQRLLTLISDELKNELMLRELPSSLDALMTLCIRVHDRVHAHRSSHARLGYEPLGLHGASTAACGRV